MTRDRAPPQIVRGSRPPTILGAIRRSVKALPGATSVWTIMKAVLTLRQVARRRQRARTNWGRVKSRPAVTAMGTKHVRRL